MFPEPRYAILATMTQALTESVPFAEDLLGLMPQKLREDVVPLIQANPQLFNASEDELKELLGVNRKISPTEGRLRFAFWQEQTRAIAEQRVMLMNNIYSGVCSYVVFRRAMAVPEIAAWIMCEPASYERLAEEALSLGMHQLRKVLEIENTDKKGRLNTQLIALKVRIIDMLDKRVRGAVVNQNLLVTYDATKEGHRPSPLENMKLEDIQRRISLLKDQDRMEAKKDSTKEIEVESESL